ncbi:MAG: hypothetical protein JXB46_09365, partial [Candidatus Eisenbacteria bacterium]|nr:hypothetical protein [Candidatus Eisenbacteria bacterium]
GTYGNVVDIVNVTGPQTGSQGSTLPDYTCPGAYQGVRYLHMAEDPHNLTPDVIIAWVTGLNDGDTVTAEYYGYDITDGGSPSHRIWGGYTDGIDPNNYISSAGGPTGYTAGTGWAPTSHTWTYAGGAGNGLQIQARLYSTPSTSDPDHTDYWIDYVCLTVPTNACVHFPQGGTPVENESWSCIKALYR